MPRKEEALRELYGISEDYDQAKLDLEAQRARLVAGMQAAVDAGATQQDVASIVNMSRQRVSQFLQGNRR